MESIVADYTPLIIHQYNRFKKPDVYFVFCIIIDPIKKQIRSQCATFSDMIVLEKLLLELLDPRGTQTVLSNFPSENKDQMNILFIAGDYMSWSYLSPIQK